MKSSSRIFHFENSDVSGDDFLLSNKDRIQESKVLAVTGFGRHEIKHLPKLLSAGVEILEKGGSLSERLREIIETSKWTHERDFLTNRNHVERGSSDTNDSLISLASFDDTIKLLSLTPYGEALDLRNNLYNFFHVAASETRELQLAIQEFEDLINDRKAKEADFQNFFDRNQAFILNSYYRRAHPHIGLARHDGTTLIPDFILEPPQQGQLCDLLELKLPSSQVYVLKKNRFHFSAAVLEARAQLREYANFFDEEKNRAAIQHSYGLLAYKPKLFVIIGRQPNLNPIDIRKIESDIPDLTVRSYDDIANRIKNKLQAMKQGKLI